MEILNLEEPLKESASLICEKAKTLCAHGVMADDCCWYHSVWQYLRLMNMVSTPIWHNEFYQNSLQEAIKGKSSVNILVSGSADYCTLAYVINAVKISKCNATIHVLDTCKTPLFACEWYANRENIKIETINQDILKYDNNNFYDIISTDAFLTRFDKENAQNVVNKWHELLKSNGKVITTVRIYENNKQKSQEEINKNVEEFTERAKVRSKCLENITKLNSEQIAQMANVYAKNMKSNSLGNKNDIIKMFANFECKTIVKTVVGEFSETKYLEIFAVKHE